MSSAIPQSVLNQANQATYGLNTTDGIISVKSKEQANKTTRDPEAQETSPQTGQTKSIKEQFNKIPIIGPMLYQLLHSILKLFGIDLDKVGQDGMSLQDAIAQAPDWAKKGLEDVLAGVKHIQQNPLKFREGLRMMRDGVKELKTSAKKNGASKDTINALGKMEGAMDRLAKAGPFSAISALKGVASAAKDLQQAFKDAPTLQQDTSRGIGLNLNKTAVGDFGEQNFDAIGKEIDDITSSADERRTFSEKAHEEGEQGEIDKQSIKDLEAGLKALETAGDDQEKQQSAKKAVGDALGNLARSYENEGDGKKFLDEAKKQIKPEQTAEDALKNISGTFSRMKKAEEARTNESSTEDNVEPKTRQNFSADVEAAAEQLRRQAKGRAEEAAYDPKAPDAGGTGTNTGTQQNAL